ncbi:MAG: phosphodiester glycosidase family protein [Cyanobacteriota bacterium]
MPAPFVVLLGMTLALAPPPPPPLPDPALRTQPSRSTTREASLPGATADQGLTSGRVVVLAGRRQQARWQWQPATAGQPEQLWLPLEVLEGQLGVTSRSRSDGSLLLDWFGRQLAIPPEGQRSLDDEVAVEVSTLVRPLGLQLSQRDDRLTLMIDAQPLKGIRHRSSGGRRRIVLDLQAATWIRRDPEGLLVGLSSQTEQVRQLEHLGLTVRQEQDQLLLQPGSGQRLEQVLSLGTPYRIALELTGAGTPSSSPTGPADDARSEESRLRALLPASMTWQKQVLAVGSQSVLVNAIRFDPRGGGLVLQPLTGASGMQGLNSLVTLAGRQQALVAINGGYFNRVRRLPLGALRDGGRWLSGPILQRGVVAWRPRQLPRFGRLNLEESLVDGSGARWPVLTLNSGFVQRGLSRYTFDWGPVYRALSGGESALLIRGDQVLSRIADDQLTAGQPLTPGDTLVVARGGVPLPGDPGDTVTVISRPSNDLGEEPNVLGGGPLLLSGGRIVLDGERERFSPAFLSQGAPRTVIGSDGRELWLLTLEGVGDSGPTLGQTAQLLRDLGLQDALNLDGGSSTGLVLAGVQTVRGRGVASSVHNGLGLVPLTPTSTVTSTRPLPK